MTARDGSLPHEGGGQEDKGVRTQEQTPDRGVGVFCQSKMPSAESQPLLGVAGVVNSCWGHFSPTHLESQLSLPFSWR